MCIFCIFCNSAQVCALRCANDGIWIYRQISCIAFSAVCRCPCLAHGQEHETVHGLGCLERSIVYCLGALCCLPACMLGPQLRADVRKQHDLDDDGCNGAFKL